MSDDLDKLLAALRRACKPGTWSSGVNLVRADGVTLESRNEEEIVLRVRAQGRAVPAQVVLYPTCDEWDCDCPGRLRPCEHLAAAAIALTQEGGPKEEAKPVQSSQATWARVEYRFTSVEAGLSLRRFIRQADGTTTPLEGTLSSLLSKPALAKQLQAEQWDIQADRLLEMGSRGVLSPGKMDALVKVLDG